MKTPKEIVDAIIATGARQKDIVDNTGMSKSFISEIANGKCKDMESAHMSKLLDFHKKVMRRRPRKVRATTDA